MSTKGTVVAAMVAGLFATAAPISMARAAGGVHCEGANACKGKSECKTAGNACSGQNGCKGKGWISAKDEKECKAKGGKVSAAK